MAKVVTDDMHYTNIARQIRAMCANDPISADAATKQYTPSVMEGGIAAVYNAGKNVGAEAGTLNGMETQKQAFWNSYQLGGSEMNYAYAFGGAGWNDATFYPKYTILHKAGESGAYMFYQNAVTNIRQRLEECGITLDVSGATSGYCMFAYSKTEELPILHFSEICTTIGQAFVRCSNLVTIEELWVHENMVFNTTFNNCTALENLTVVGTIGQNGFNVQWSNKLSRQSIESIMSALSATTTGLSVTLSESAVNTAFETEEGAADGSTSDEWASLIDAKGNWTISLV